MSTTDCNVTPEASPDGPVVGAVLPDGKKSAPRRLLQWAKDWLVWVAELDETNHQIALGLAVGIFVGFLPIMGIQMSVAVPIAFFLRCNKLLAAAGVWITNPATFIPLYYFNYRFGLWVWDAQPKPWEAFSDLFRHFSFDRLLKESWDFLAPLWLGSFVLGVIGSICTYGAMLFLVRYIRRRRGISSAGRGATKEPCRSKERQP